MRMADDEEAAPAVDGGEEPPSEEPASDDPSSNERKPQFNNIDIFLRVKPVPRPANRIVIDPLEGSVEFNIPRDAAAGLINNSKEKYLFSFNGILTPEAKQDEVSSPSSVLQQLLGSSQTLMGPMTAGLRACSSTTGYQCLRWFQCHYLCVRTDRLWQDLHNNRRCRALC
eukprot:GHUV01040234.1.p1 GENE.GHUV01040234.1~~GHUV01040234.1.p1  ORF type:complete len:170 (+),score=23.47 GHUV01040234.1:502-1011(+)